MWPSTVPLRVRETVFVSVLMLLRRFGELSNEIDDVILQNEVQIK